MCNVRKSEASAGANIKIQKRRKEKSKMANPEHLAKLKEGVEAWNKMRQASKISKMQTERRRLR